MKQKVAVMDTGNFCGVCSVLNRATRIAKYLKKNRNTRQGVSAVLSRM